MPFDPRSQPRRLLATIAAMMIGAVVPAAAEPAAPERVVVNGLPLSADEVRMLERRSSIRAQPGRYWYDATCGAWGFEGGPTLGFLPARLQLGGPLRADASGGGSGAFIDGREPQPLDVWALPKIGPVWRGRWRVDAQGTFGPEGGPAWDNLWLLAQQRGAQRSPLGRLRGGGLSSDGKHFLGNGCGYYQGSNLVGGATTYSPPGC